MSAEKYGWDNQGSKFCHTRENSKMFSITPKFSAFSTTKHLQTESRI